MNFLQLCSGLRQEGGMTGTGPTSVVGQSGEMLRVVSWVTSAYEYVQNLHPNWHFLRADVSFPTVSGTASYDSTATNCPEVGSYKLDSFKAALTSVGVADEQEMEYYPWDQFRAVYLRGSSSTLTGRPRLFSVKPDQSLVLWPKPDAIYTVTGEYFKRAQEMTADADIPIIPQQFQKIILWKALMLYGAYAGANDAYSHGNNEYRATLSKLVLNQLPKVGFGAPLA